MRSPKDLWLVCLCMLGAIACGPEPKEAGLADEIGTARQALMSIPWMSQYQGQACQNYDCGPASVAMLVKYWGLSSLSNKDLQVQVRTRGTGTTSCGDTGFSSLETALGTYGLTYSEVSSSLTPAPSAQMTAMKNATDSGKPVIALIHGADFGRGCSGTVNYGDHWLVVRGFSSDNSTVYLNDPDNQAARCSGWIVGGQISVPYSTFSKAAYDAAPGSPYGIIVSYSGPTGPYCSSNCGGGGWWCAGDGSCITNGVSGHNYHCPGNNAAPDRDQACGAGCQIAASGYPDYCKSTSFCGGGAWCGNDCVGGYSSTLYNFTSGGSLSSVTQCSVGYTNQRCVIASGGYPDYCN